MKIAITGATGFIGKGLTGFLLGEGNSIVVLSRDPERARSLFDGEVSAFSWSFENKDKLVKELEGVDAFVNLAGENVGSSLWTKNKKRKIIESRIRAGQLTTELICSMKRPPRVLIQASAVGYYGTRGEEVIAENSECGKGFLPEVTARWEYSTAIVESSGVRYVTIRSGLVLSKTGGAFPKLASPYNLHIGTMLGSGKQWVPWIHLEDEIRAIYFLIMSGGSNGIYNLVAPSPARMSEVCEQLGTTIFKMPDGLMKLIMGQMAEETILTSQRVVPERILNEGFQFKFTNVKGAIADICGKRTG